MNGKIWFESEYGAGTTFYVDINQKIVDSSKIGDILTTKSLSDEHVYIDCSNYKVLIIPSIIRLAFFAATSTNSSKLTSAL